MLNTDQQKALTRFISFVASDDKDLIISGPAGAGKGYLLTHIETEFLAIAQKAKLLNSNSPFVGLLPIFTATTNEAVGAMGVVNAATIYRHCGLRVYNNKLHPYKAPDKAIQVVFVDEASYVDEDAYIAIRTQLPNAKIVWVLDAYQLAPVGSDFPYVVTMGIKTVELEKIERSKGDIQDFVRDLRQAVKDEQPVEYRQYHNGTTIQVVNGKQLEPMIREAFSKGIDAKVLGYRNAKVSAFNDYVNENILGNPKFPYPDAQAEVRVYNEHRRVRVGSRCVIYDVEPNKPVQRVYGGNRDAMTYQVTEVTTSRGNFYIPQEKDVKVLQGEPDALVLALPYAGTVHKAQGRTIETVFVDARDICNNWDQNMKRRLMYVAISRASKNVVICI